ncbi:MAG TPA: copper homeostasis protein CutC [Gemmatimonadaceae bacterium]|nr:copper homeostasis protein CutC [Gemmatimonadaceae bacterium]
MSRLVLEIAANSLGSALAAEEGGADRVELCDNLGGGGTTPSYGTIAIARDRLRVPLYVLIRPRTGDFCYDAAEVKVMLCDIESCVRLGCDGVVIGALDIDGDVDETVCRELIAAAGSLGVTFHRAFDAARDQVPALDSIMALGCERVLTSGGEADALAGAERIAGFVKQAGSRLKVMAGAGIDAGNIGEVAVRSNAHEFHGSARGMRSSPSRHRNGRLRGLEVDWWESDAGRVRAMVNALSRLDSQPTPTKTR